MKTITLNFKPNMMRIKSNFKLIAITLFLGTFLYSCNSDDDGSSSDAPLISNFEYGEGSSHSTNQVAYKGSDIHIEADISAEAIVSSITLSIHAHDLTPSDGEEDWDFVQVFTDSNYLALNPTFHEHIDVPTNIPSGEYHVELLVIDESGNSTEVEGYIQILDYITLSEISIASSVARGSDLHTEFLINAVNGIHNISVDIHAHDLTPADGEVEWEYEAVFEEGYHELTEADFHEHIDVPATASAGE